MKKLSNILLMAGVAFLATLAITSCKPNVPDTNPLNKQGVNLVAYGPNPVARGGYLRMLGTGMDQIKTITIAGQEITPIEVVSNEEIKVLVPQDAKIGDLVLTPNSGDAITGRVKITYTEPVGFDKDKPFEPATVKAGQTLTINGEYLNLVTKVILPEGVEVTKFKEHDRKHIVIENFPATAKTGAVTLSFVATGDTMAQEIPSEAKLEVVLPSVDMLEAKEVKAGQVIRVAGKDLDLVTAVLSTTDDSLYYELVEDNKYIDIRMPEVVMNGVVNIVVASGIKIPTILIGVALPKVASVEDNTGVKEGSEVVINGTDMAIVSAINFVDAKGNAITVDGDGISVTDTKVTVAVPAMAVTGAMVIKTTAEIDVEDEKLTIVTLKPEVAAFNPAEVNMGGTVAVNGTNLDLVAKVTLTGGAVLTPADASATTFNITIPYADAETGKVTLTMKNGETVETTVELTINAPLCAYVIEWPELIDDEPIQAGQLLRIVVGNREKLTAVQIDGQDCGFLFNGEDVVFISTPESAGPSSKVKLISEGVGEIEYDYAFKPNTEIVTVLWKGEAVADAWGNQPTFLTDGGAEITAAGVVAGDEIVFYLQRIRPEEGFNFDIQEGHWGAKYATLCDLNAEDPERENYDLEGNKGMVKFTVTEEMLTTWTTPQYWGGVFLINGNNIICSKIANVHHVSLEVDCKPFLKYEDRTGTFDYPYFPSWGDNSGKLRLFRDNGLKDLNLKAGKSKIIFYKDPATTGQIQFCNPNWGALTTVADWDGGLSTLEYVFDEEAIKCVTGETADGWSETAFVMQGDGLKVTKITILP